MTLEIKQPELEALIQDRLKTGEFRDIDELLTKALHALPESRQSAVSERPRRRLIDVLTSTPFAGSELTVERRPDYLLPVDL